MGLELVAEIVNESPASEGFALSVSDLIAALSFLIALASLRVATVKTREANRIAEDALAVAARNEERAAVRWRYSEMPDRERMWLLVNEGTAAALDVVVEHGSATIEKMTFDDVQPGEACALWIAVDAEPARLVVTWRHPLTQEHGKWEFPKSPNEVRNASGEQEDQH